MTTFYITEHIVFRDNGQPKHIQAWAACLCGSAFRISTSSPDAYAKAVEIWTAQHQGEGHGSTDARTARKVRQRKERNEQQCDHDPGNFPHGYPAQRCRKCGVIQ